MVNYSAVICEQGHVIIYDSEYNIINRLGPWATIEEAEDYAVDYVNALNTGLAEKPETLWEEYPPIALEGHEITNS